MTNIERLVELVTEPSVRMPSGLTREERHSWAADYDPDRCLVCGEHHNHGNLPYPTMRVTSNATDR